MAIIFIIYFYVFIVIWPKEPRDLFVLIYSFLLSFYY